MEEQAKYKTEAGVQQKLAAMFAANKDEVSIPKIYIDMTGDWKAAAVLDELLFWTLPKKGTGKTSLRVFRNGVRQRWRLYFYQFIISCNKHISPRTRPSQTLCRRVVDLVS